MAWYWLMALFVGALVVLLILRVPVAIGLFSVTLVMAIVYYGFDAGMRMMGLSTYNAVVSFSLVPIALFIFMGDLLFRLRVAGRAIDALAEILKKVPARLGLLTTASGALFGILSGSSIANTALLGKTYLKQMKREGYTDTLSMGSVLAAGGLAMVLPPTTVGIIWAVTAEVPVGPFLLAGFGPGIIMLVLYAAMIMLWGTKFKGIRPELAVATAGADDVNSGRKLKTFAKDVLPLGLVVFAALGLIFLGWATPSESSAMGVIAAVVLSLCYRTFNWRKFWLATRDSAMVAGMLLIIFASSGGYSQLMSFSGATRGFINAITDLGLPPIALLIMIQIVILILGTFLEQIAIIMVTLPLLMPVVTEMGWNPIWFGIMMLINLEMGLLTPPFGMGLFVMKTVAPKETRITTIYKAAIPFVIVDAVTIGLIMIFPDIALAIPNLMG